MHLSFEKLLGLEKTIKVREWVNDILIWSFQASLVVQVDLLLLHFQKCAKVKKGYLHSRNGNNFSAPHAYRAIYEFLQTSMDCTALLYPSKQCQTRKWKETCSVKSMNDDPTVKSRSLDTVFYTFFFCDMMIWRS